MRLASTGALVALFAVACSQGTASDVASGARTSPSPSPGAMSTRLSCGDSHVGATALAIYRYATTYPSIVGLLDVSSPLNPSLACTLSPAYGAHILSPTRLAFWNDNELGTADLGSGAITQTARLSADAANGAFSADGTKFAYRSYVDGGAMTTHLVVNGLDRVLYVQEALGGHGGSGSSFGPFDQLQFSPDGSLLLDYMLFRPQSGPPNLVVLRTDGSIVFQTAGATGGAWSPTGHTLFFYAANQTGTSGDLNRLDANGQQQVVVSGMQRMYWPAMIPDGSGIIYNASDSSVPDCGGLPHLWRLDLGTGRSTQIAVSISSGPVFVQPAVIWSDHQQPGPCGLGGPSSPDGVIIAHYLNTGLDTLVSTINTVPGAGHGVLGPSTSLVIDTWFAPA